jgi:hypothetical protein
VDIFILAQWIMAEIKNNGPTTGLTKMLYGWSSTIYMIFVFIRKFNMAARPIMLPDWLKFQKSSKLHIRNRNLLNFE